MYYTICELLLYSMEGIIHLLIFTCLCFLPPALFLMRDDAFLSNVPPQYKSHFIDENPIAVNKLEMLKKQIKERFPVSLFLN